MFKFTRLGLISLLLYFAVLELKTETLQDLEKPHFTQACIAIKISLF